ncbi:MAG TPA: protein kinase, partial [Solirubrobacteraceae bacterium]|nr:protein kinase [Solirubrobacteraceae bacterium]
GRALDGRYELHELVGEGTFGRVYRGLDRRLRRPVAVKVIKPWWSDDPDWAERFEREAQLLARVSDPGIVQIFDVGQADDGLFYVAELVEGESLADRLRRGPLDVDAALDVSEQLCRALAHTHARGVIHRDIKPANVLLGDGGRVKLGDFGLARASEASSDGPATLAGTPKYMAPELARGAPATAAADLYSLGVVLYEMLAGTPPFPDGPPVEVALRHLQDPPPPLPADVPPAVAAVVARALAKDPAERFGSAGEMGDALSAARRDPAAAPTAVPARVRRAATRASGRAERGRGARAVDRTAVAPQFAPRRTMNPAARRRAGALIAAVFALIAGMLVAARLIGATDRVTVPSLQGLSRAAALRSLEHAHLRGALASRYDSAGAGTVIAQSPGPYRRLDAGSAVRVVVSAGPPPVRLPVLTSESGEAARARLGRLGLSARIVQVPAPGVGTGMVTGQWPAAGRLVPAHSSVRLTVAEAPRWRVVSSFAGFDGGASTPFTIRGSRWRVVYSMSYVGTCTLLFFCDGPTAHVHVASGGSDTQFDLSDGSSQTQSFDSGPGVYSIEITPGNDDARWSFTVQDWY